MKHIIKKYSNWRAACSRPGCLSSLQGGMVDKMNQVELEQFFSIECPYTWSKEKGGLRGKESIEHILNYAKKEIKAWDVVIKYWEKNKGER